MKKLFIFLLTFAFASCASFDVDAKIHSQIEEGVSQIKKTDQGASKNKKNAQAQAPEPEKPPTPPEVIVVQQPVFIPEKEAQPKKQTPSADSVRAATSAGTAKPEDFSHAALVYDYNPDWVYEAYAMPLRVCDIRLEPGEHAVDTPFVSDSERWKIGAGVSYENGFSVQHVYVKPDAAGQEATLIINTDRRVYHLILRSFNSTHTPIVRWRYVSGLPENYISSNGSASNAQQAFSDEKKDDSPFSGVDPRFLSFNYKISYGLFGKPSWCPDLVFDDGSKTYISFPKQVLQKEMPSVFENRKDILNYRVMGNLIVIDKLVVSITVKIDRSEIVITKKRGSP